VTLLQIHRLRLRAAGLGIRRLEIGVQSAVVEFGTGHRVDPARVIRLLQQGGGRYRLDGQQRLRLKLESPDASARFRAAAALLDDLGG
jgi:transcription-repair coupling factor (superfamily II helicase)